MPKPATSTPALTRVSASSLVLIFLCLLLSGCFVGDFITTYFNTYYNAQRAFNEAQDEVWNLPETKLSGRNFLTQFTISAPLKTKFTSVIEKCSKLLQYHSNSQFVDDALMMIGKSYYYQAEYQKAERKFRELLDSYPGSGLALEARLMLAYSYYKMLDKEKATATAKELRDQAMNDGQDVIVAGASLVLGQIEMENAKYADAREDYQRVVEYGENLEQRSSASLNVAELFAREGNYRDAELAFRKADENANNYLSEYRSKIGIARMQAKQGRSESAIEQLRNLRSNSNYKEFFGEIDLEIANTYRDSNDLDAAIQRYRYVNTMYARSEKSAYAYFALGQLYETQFLLFDSARVAYNKGKSEFPTALVTPQLTRRADYLNRYFQYKSEIIKYDSMKAQLLVSRDTSDGQGSGLDSSSAVGTGKTGRLVPSLLLLDTVETRLANSKSELASLFYTSLGMIDSAKYWFDRIISEHPTSRNVPRILYTLAEIARTDSTVAQARVDSLYREIIRRFPRSDFAVESRRILGLPQDENKTDGVSESYGRAESLMLKGENNAAIDSFRAIVARFPSSLLAPKAQYAIGLLYEESGLQADSAIANYERLVALYPFSPYAGRVKPILAQVELKRNPGRAAGPVDSAAARAPGTAPAQKKTVFNDDDIPRLRPVPPGAQDSGAVLRRPVRPAADTLDEKVDPR